MNWAIRFGFGKGMILIDASKFPQQKSDSISAYFHGENPTVLRLRCVIAHKTLSLSSFRHENMATKVPHFHGENLAEFCIWCIMAHW